MKQFGLHFRKIAGVTTFVLWLLCGNSHARTLYWERIDVDIFINPDSTVDVSEKLEYVFTGAWNGGYRDIRMKGFDAITDIQVWEEGTQYQEGSAENKYGFVIERNGGNKRIKWRSRLPSEPEYNYTHKTFTVTYKLHGLLNYLKNEDELYWKAIFEERDGTVQQATVKVILPGSVDSKSLSVTLYTGVSGAAWKLPDPKTILFTGANLQPNQLFEVKVLFPKGLVERKVTFQGFMRRNVSPFVPFALPAMTTLVMFLLYIRLGKDYESQISPAPVSSPPSELPPAVAGTLLDEKSDMKEIIATVVDLARRGCIEMTELVQKVWVFSSRDFELKLKRVPESPEKFESKILKGLFGRLETGDKVKFSGLREQFYVHIPKITDEIYKSAIKLGFFEGDPRKIRRKYLFAGALLVGLGFIPLFVMGPELGFMLLWTSMFAGIPGYMMIQSLKSRNVFPILFLSIFVFVGLGFGGTFILKGLMESSSTISGPFGAGLVYSGIIIALFSSHMPRKTLKGSQEKEKWLGFKKYLEDVQNVQSVDTTQQTFENYLPYAIAFGVEKKWMEKFSRLDCPSPGWYHSSFTDHTGKSFHTSSPEGFSGFGGGASGGAGAGRGFTVGTMANSFNSMISGMSSSLSSSPSSSGSGGGGSSGGGGGGGGGW